jgi:RNase_H superfamily
VSESKGAVESPEGEFVRPDRRFVWIDFVRGKGFVMCAARASSGLGRASSLERLRNGCKYLFSGAANSRLEEQVENLINSDIWVDLKRVFENSWITGGSAGLKSIAPLAGFEWDVDDPGGGLSMVKYDEAVAVDSQAADPARDWILDYNRGDVEATSAIREWLTAEGSGWPEVDSR